MSSSGVFAIPQNLKKKTKKVAKATSGAPIVVELALDKESGLYSLEFAGKKRKLFGLTLIVVDSKNLDGGEIAIEHNSYKMESLAD